MDDHRADTRPLRMNRNVSSVAMMLLAIGITFLATAAACAADESPDPEPQRTVVWLSIDGIRPDYLDRAETPFLDSLAAEGAYSRELVPVFPSLTFPSHVSKATGVKVKDHGVPGNVFIDRTDWRVHRYPWQSRLLEAEPIWTTATRQGVRTAVVDWPLSHAQRGEHAAAIHGERYIRGMSDRERLAVLLDAWEEDSRRAASNDPPGSQMRLLMGYGVGPDALGHRYGPDAEPPAKHMENVDAMLREAKMHFHAIWKRNRRAGDELYLIVTTDHGMSKVHTLVNLEHLAGLTETSPVETVTSGNVAHLFLRDAVDDAERDALINALVERVADPAYARAWKRDGLPEHWQYNHPDRTGDVVVVLDTGYTFSRRPEGVTGSAKELGGPLGMHGYCPRENPEMNGVLFIQRYPKPLGGKNLGRVHSLQLHAAVAELLGIEPASGAQREAILR